MTPEEFAERRRSSNLKTLRVLLILSFIYTGAWTLCHFMLGASGPETRETMMGVYQTLAEKNDTYEPYAIMCERLFAVPQWYYVICGLLDAISFVGLLLMWRLRRNGFHCYTLAKLLLMLMPLLFLDRSYVGLGDIMIGILFIVYYFFLLKGIGLFGGSSPKRDNAPVEE